MLEDTLGYVLASVAAAASEGDISSFACAKFERQVWNNGVDESTARQFLPTDDANGAVSVSSLAY